MISVAYAQTGTAELDQFLGRVYSAILDPFILLLFAVALVVFLWGVMGFVQNSEDPAARKDGISHIIWGTFGMFIMLSFWGLLNFIQGTVGT